MNTNKQQQAAVLLVNLLAACPQRRKELMKEQHSFVAVIRGEETIVAHGEFFMQGDVPFHEIVKTHTGVSFRNALTGEMCFIPFCADVTAPVVAPVVAPVAAPAVVVPAVVAPAPAPKVVSTLSRRVGFGETVEIYNSLFQLVEIFETPSSGAMVQQLFDDGSKVIRFTGIIEKTWTI